MKKRIIKSTPGPWSWSVDKWNGGFSGLYGPDGQDVCVPLCCNEGDTGAAWFNPEDEPDRAEELQANLNLIAATPELLYAFMQLLDSGWLPAHDGETLNKRKKAHLHGRLLVKKLRGKV